MPESIAKWPHSFTQLHRQSSEPHLKYAEHPREGSQKLCQAFPRPWLCLHPHSQSAMWLCISRHGHKELSNHLSATPLTSKEPEGWNHFSFGHGQHNRKETENRWSNLQGRGWIIYETYIDPPLVGSRAGPNVSDSFVLTAGLCNRSETVR